MRRIVLGIVAALVLLGAIGYLLKGTNELNGSSRPSGQIIFGTTVDMTNGTIASPVTSVKAGTLVGWVAYFSASANVTTVSITIARLHSGNAEESLFTGNQDVANPQTDTWAHDVTDAMTSQGPGDYTLRYVRPSDGTILAAGTLTVTP